MSLSGSMMIAVSPAILKRSPTKGELLSIVLDCDY